MQPGQGINFQNLPPAQQAAAQQMMLNMRGNQAGVAAGWAALPQQQPGRTVSPVQGQTALNQAALQHHNSHMLQQLIMQQQRQVQAQAQAAQLAQAAAGQPGRPRSMAASAAGIRGPGMAAVGSAGNLANLGTASLAAQHAALQRPGSNGVTSATLAAMGRPLGLAGGLYPGGPGRPLSAINNPAAAAAGAGGGVGVLDPVVKAQVQAALKAMKPGEAPKVEPPDGHEWVQCAGKDGKPGWFAVLKAQAQAIRSAAAAAAAASGGNKRKAEDAPGGQPAGKQGGKRKGVDDDLVAGGGPVSMLLMDEDAVEAEEAAAKAAVVVEAGNVQEEYLLNPNATMTLVARAAKEGGVKAVSDAVYPFLSLAGEAFLAQLINSMVKTRLQREDMGKGYFGVVSADRSQGDVRAKLYKMREDEKRKAGQRAEQELNELAKLGSSRKKLGEEEKKAAAAAKAQRDLENKKVKVGSTLSELGIRHRAFSMMGKAASRTGTSKPGLTKQELLDAKTAAAASAVSSSTTAAAAAASAATPAASSTGPSASAATTAAGTGAQDAAAAGGVKQEPGTQAAAAAAGGGSSGAIQPAQSAASSANAAAAGGATASSALKPMSLQHQLLGESDLQPTGTPFVAGGVPAKKAGEAALRELTLTDLVAVLERHPLYCRSPELYTLHALAALQADPQK